MPAWPAAKVEALRRVLKDQPRLAPTDTVIRERSRPQGHVAAVLEPLKRRGVAHRSAAKRMRQRDWVGTLLVERLLRPGAQLATTRRWQRPPLGALLAVADADAEERYPARAWLLAWQARSANKRATRHYGEGRHGLYAVSRSYAEGQSCPLVQLGDSREGARGQPRIGAGVLTGLHGRPTAVAV